MDLVILIEFPLNKRDYERFGIEYLAKKFSITILDLSLITNRIYKKKNYREYNPIKIKYIKIFSFYHLFLNINKIKNIKCIDFLNDNIKIKFIRIFMSCFNLKLIRTSHGTLPNYRNQNLKILRNLARKILYEYNNYYIYISSCLKAEKRKSKNILYSHTFDYDIFLKNKQELISIKSQYTKKIVFIDQCLSDHPDLAFNNMTHVNQETYYNEIKNFLDNLKYNNNKVTINIALHPKTPKIIPEKYFKNFNCYQNQTEEIIKNSDFVIHHFSTAISFAYLHKKPILVIYTNEMKNFNNFKVTILPYLQKHKSLKQMYLDYEPINISEKNKIDMYEFRNINKQNYISYIENFVKHPKSVEQNSWKIFFEFVKENKL